MGGGGGGGCGRGFSRDRRLSSPLFSFPSHEEKDDSGVYTYLYILGIARQMQ